MSTVKATKHSPKPEPKVYTITLSNLTKDEAEALLDVSELIGGIPSETPRSLFDSISAELRGTGLLSGFGRGSKWKAKGSIYLARTGEYFNEYQ